MNVLMVDDHVMFLQGIKNLLSVLVPDLRVETSGEMAHAVQLVQLTDFDLVLLDWHLNDGDCEQSIEFSHVAAKVPHKPLDGQTLAHTLRNVVLELDAQVERALA